MEYKFKDLNLQKVLEKIEKMDVGELISIFNNAHTNDLFSLFNNINEDNTLFKELYLGNNIESIDFETINNFNFFDDCYSEAA